MTNPPSDFLWGVATSGHQTEGFNVASDTWFLENVAPTVFMERSGIACDSYERWESDLDLVAGMGLNAYRFSIEWARVEPEPGRIDESALDHYSDVVDGCLARGLAPVVTFNHFTSPHWFAVRGGWLDPEAPDLFVRYVDAVMGRLGDRIALAVTFNEPNLSEMLTWSDIPSFISDLTRATLEAAGEATGVAQYRSANVMLPEDFDGMRAGMTEGHLAAKRAIKAHRADLPVGLSIAIVDDVAVPGGEALRDRKREEVYGHWLRVAAGDDFVGIQNYERIHYGPDGVVPPAPDTLMSDMGGAVMPDSLRGSIEYAHRMSGVPVFVTEHGMAASDDSLRAAFIPAAIEGMVAAMDAGVPVLGYCHWTLMDNFEWVFGYSQHFGLHAVDRDTMERIPKPSAHAYRQVVASWRTP
ncbi:MAG: beta-glucosidase [Microbacterium sp.]|jgi:beta-glucosidase|nr:beta-glucosidase [Microbacterium sp.]